MKNPQKEDFLPRSEAYKSSYSTLGPPGPKTHVEWRETMDNHWTGTEGISKANCSVLAGPSMLAVLFLHYILCCASVPNSINLLQLHLAVIRVCGSSILDNALVEPIPRRVIGSPANTRMPGRVTGYVRERSILVWTVITLCAEN